jgi:hypothetical protein
MNLLWFYKIWKQLKSFYYSFLQIQSIAFLKAKLTDQKDLTSPSRTDNNNKDNEGDSNSSSHVSFDNEFRNIFFQVMYLTYYSIIGNYDIENHLHNNLSNYPYDSNLSGNFENSDSVSPTINYLKARLRESTSFKSQQFIWKSFKSKFVLISILYKTDLYTIIEYNKAENTLMSFY